MADHFESGAGLLSVFGCGDELCADDLRQVVPFAQCFLAERPDIIVRLVEDVLKPLEIPVFLRMLRLWAEQEGRFTALQNYVDVLDRTGMLAAGLADMKSRDGVYSEAYRTISLLARHGDAARFAKFVEAARDAGDEAYLHPVGDAVMTALERGNADVVDSACDYLDGHGKLIQGRLLRAAARADNRALAEKIVELARARGVLPRLLLEHKTLFDMCRDGIGQDSAYWVGVAAELAHEVEAMPEATVPVYGKETPVPDAIRSIAEEYTGLIYNAGVPGACDITDILLGYTPDLANEASNLGCALSGGKHEVLEILSGLAAGDERRERYVCTLVHEWECFREDSAVLRRFADLCNYFSTLASPRRRQAAVDADAGFLPAVIAIPDNVPDDFNRDLYRQIHPLARAFDAAGYNGGHADEWARKLTIMFADMEEVLSFMRSSIGWVCANTDDQNIWRRETYGGLFRWPDRTEGWEMIRPGVYEAALDFDLPPQRFNTKGWRALVLQAPEIARYLSRANDIEGWLDCENRTFPETPDAMRQAVFDEIMSRHSLTDEGDLRAAMAGVERSGRDDLDPRLQYGMQFDLLFPSQRILSDFDALTQLGVLGRTARQRTRMNTAAIDRGTPEYGQPWTYRVVREDGGSVRLFDRDLDWEIEDKPCVERWRMEGVQCVFRGGGMEAVQCAVRVLRDLGAIQADWKGSAEFHINAAVLPPDEQWALERRVLINLLRAGIPFNRIFVDNYITIADAGTGKVEKKRIRDDCPEDLEDAVRMILRAQSRADLPRLLPPYGTGTIAISAHGMEIRKKDGPLMMLSDEKVTQCLAFFVAVVTEDSVSRLCVMAVPQCGHDTNALLRRGPG